MVANARQNFDEDGGLKDEKARQLIAEMLEELVSWTRKLKKN